MKLPVALSLLVLAFAGCTGTEGKDDAAAGGPRLDGGLGVLDVGDPTAEPVLDLDAGVPVPVWNVGDWWQYQVDYASGESYDAKVVVYAEDATNYYVTSDDRELILRAAFTHYPTIGAVAKASLNQFIHGVEVSYLQFPMKNGTWEGQFRDFTAAYATTFTALPTGQGEVPGFATTVRNAADGNVRIGHGWSPVTKWFTNFTFDFFGDGAADVSYSLQAWGTNHTGALPVLEIIDGVHRLFPTVVAGPPDPANPPNPAAAPPPHDSFEVGTAGSSILAGMFAGAGGAGDFEFELGYLDGPGTGYSYRWPAPAAGGSHFEWHEIATVAAGEWGVLGSGSAQGSAFLFLEAYEVKTTDVTLPAA